VRLPRVQEYSVVDGADDDVAVPTSADHTPFVGDRDGIGRVTAVLFAREQSVQGV